MMTRQFRTDGCSGGLSRAWRIALRSDPPWEGCCIMHDHAYWLGGSRFARKQADLALLSCVARNGHPWWAIAMYAAVRAFGGPFWPMPRRWGYGQGRPRYYQQEKQQ
jgi:hypothetical protein